ncbi:hypothetical protein BEWA_002720 [Theileria equi strain WA]|uniref:Uncharacterized protein n=1 Tax=Theileria equi strain WA TaxID=1537102 RepID=L0AZ78_THEEQ|nr:hypothetical protein BEWA_002720 [Theileria equi strain WA]AFZ80865.1 hypothetical protein BEWA_002720 [Theileria equi strain WA]|eukprot:XP_004830531.1 hypothetical protein BEWA_002720 [Theileria equi strain WA]
MNNDLVLELNARCGEGKDKCNCIDKPPGITARKELDVPEKGFIKITHNNGNTFTLSGQLKNGDQIRVRGKIGRPIQNVTEVSVYYWAGNDKEPILLGVTTGGGSGTTTRYCRIKGSALWVSGLVQDKTELEALDQQNCHNNDAVVFNIQDSQSGSFTGDSKSYCTRVTRNITESTSYPPPGSDYVTTVYIIKGIDTKIARVTYKSQSTDIPPINFPVDVIALYSYPSAMNVPLMLELKPPGNGNSKWFYSQTSDGTSWIEEGGGDTFYDRDNDPKPTAKLSEKLDEVLCKQYDNVTLNLTKNHSDTHARAKTKYCCNEHKGEECRISLQEGNITVAGKQMTEYYKHSISGSAVAGIYYKDGGQRKKIALLGSPFPISVKSVYAFYCKGEEPSLIYVDSTNGMVRGWYKRDNGEWKWNSKLSVIKSTDLSNLSCAKWKRLKKVLEECNCNGLPDCSYSDNTKEVSEEKQLAEEEEEAKRKRAVAQKLIPVAVSGPSSNNGSYAGHSDASESGGRDNCGDEPGSSSSSSILSSPKGSPDSSTPVVSNSGTGGVTIKLDRTSYSMNLNGGETIDVTPYYDSKIIGYNAFKHTYSHGIKFTIRDFTLGDRKQIFFPGVTPAEEVKSVIVYFLSCRNNVSTTKVPLLVYINGDYGKRHNWYTRRDVGKKWVDISNELKDRPPHKANSLQITLQNIAKHLGISCKEDWKGPVSTSQNNDINEVIDLGTNGLQNNDIGGAIPPLMPAMNHLNLGIPVKQIDNKIIGPLGQISNKLTATTKYTPSSGQLASPAPPATEELQASNPKVGPPAEDPSQAATSGSSSTPSPLGAETTPASQTPSTSTLGATTVPEVELSLQTPPPAAPKATEERDPEKAPVVGLLTSGSALAGYAFSGTLAGAGGLTGFDSSADVFPPPLVFASSIGNAEIVGKLLKSGANVNIGDSQGWTSLHCASEYGHLEIVKMLIEYGADSKLKIQENNAYHLAIWNGHADIAEFLKDYTDDTDQVNFVHYSQGLETDAKAESFPVIDNLDEKEAERIKDEITRTKDFGGNMVKAGDFVGATEAYSKALSMCPGNPEFDQLRSILFSNRSHMYLKRNEAKKALEDAKEAVKIQPNWSKGYIRLANAYRDLNEPVDYLHNLFQAYVRDSENTELRNRFQSEFKRYKK